MGHLVYQLDFQWCYRPPSNNISINKWIQNFRSPLFLIECWLLLWSRQANIRIWQISVEGLGWEWIEILPNILILKCWKSIEVWHCWSRKLWIRNQAIRRNCWKNIPRSRIRLGILQNRNQIKTDTHINNKMQYHTLWYNQ